MSDPKIVDILVSLVTSFDVMLIQEVVDVSGKAVKALLQAVNDASKDQGICPPPSTINIQFKNIFSYYTLKFGKNKPNQMLRSTPKK